MSRYRPPSPPKSAYITQEGAQALLAELKYLWKEKRPAVTETVREAAAQGDRSENAEYIYGKKQLREIDRRVRYLEKRLDVCTVVDRFPSDQERVFFGAWVTLEDEAGNMKEYRIVGPDELDHNPNYISIDSPVARALLKKQEGDEVVIRLAGGEKTYLIDSVEYRQVTT
ncbi:MULTISPECIES: transcription elongation factor GreB [Marinomonas]|uniref:Transcription elongation factor GreB n=1 Tax=Marinomonas arctica TaxID=383750 RepID=A0A7H1J4Q6_9GAMM|nr:MULTISPECIES: transcription elongation factor GreB [Marinomonas]MCS7487430.1 transcription elongation factor GreB [Marinomonas sp. BSi20414]QNT05472.1 transcription elongation factor GreB [Marinomonas arctica]GGN33351.1 transcription elongation factor GreB [Marinomonas arctica]